MDTNVVLNGSARLVELQYGRILLAFENRHFARHELVPYSILGTRLSGHSNIATMTAGEFVSVCMVERFGEECNWPNMAREYLYPKAARAPEQTVLADGGNGDE